jgi:repressor LexA
MTRENYIKQLIKDNGYNIKSFAQKIGIPYSTLLSALNGSIGGMSIDTVIKICTGLNITIDDLQNCDNIMRHKIKLNEQEKRLVIAYRQNPLMQDAVNKLLGIDVEVMQKEKRA